jgi:hypothetical protein
MKRCLPALIACLLVVVCGVVHGFWTDRWRPPTEAAEAAARMDALPQEIGDWKGETVPDKNPTAGGTAGSIQRRYTNRRTGESVSIYLVCGRVGPVAEHTPDVCYVAAGFDVGPKSLAAVADGASFWTADAARTKDVGDTRLRLYWAWSADGRWSAPDNPRFAFVRAPALFKLYVQRDLADGGPAAQEEPCVNFLRALLPELNKTLFSTGP